MKKVLFVLSVFFSVTSSAQLKLPSFIADSMVLQQQQPIHIWGWAGPGTNVQLSFMQKHYNALAGKDGRWEAWLAPAAAGNCGNLELSSGSDKIMLHDVLSGEVWICSGQSNMEWKFGWLKDTYAQELATAKDEQLRFITAEKTMAISPKTDLKLERKWSSISPGVTGECSAVAYWFAKKLRQELKVPVGVIVTAWGGTRAQPWTSYEGLYELPDYQRVFNEKVKNIDLDHIESEKERIRTAFRNDLNEKAVESREWVKPEFNDADWEATKLPGPWEVNGHPNMDGVAYYRLTFNVADPDAGKAAGLHMPAIDDIDSTFINGIFIGSKDQWDAVRNYEVKPGILRTGKNVLVIRVQDNGGGGGLADEPNIFKLNVDEHSIALSGSAKFHLMAPMKDITSGNGAMEQQPSVLFNAMIAPLVPLKIRGAIWYQGESNADQAYEYRTLFPAMIRDWRNRWNVGEFPFLFVQLASYGPLKTTPVESAWAELREAQSMTLQLPNTGMAIATDIGNPANIHPVKKKEVGDRLAVHAMNIAYGKKNDAATGPLYSSYKVSGSQIIIQFTHTGSGLRTDGKPLQYFQIAGDDHQFVWADARIVGNTIVVSAKGILKPVAVRYAWADSPVSANLYNKEGFPASAFRTDKWKGVTEK